MHTSVLLTAPFTMKALVSALAIVAFIATTAAMNDPPPEEPDIVVTTHSASSLPRDYVDGHQYAWLHWRMFGSNGPIEGTPINACGKTIFRRTERRDAIILRSISIDHSGCPEHDYPTPCQQFLGIAINDGQTFCNLVLIGIKEIYDDPDYQLRIVLRFQSPTTSPFRLGIRVGVLKNNAIRHRFIKLTKATYIDNILLPLYTVDYEKLNAIRSGNPVNLPYEFSWLGRLLQSGLFEVESTEFDLEGREQGITTFLTEPVFISRYALKRISEAISGEN